MPILVIIKNTDAGNVVSINPGGPDNPAPALFMRVPDGTDVSAIAVASPADLINVGSSGPVFDLWNANEALNPSEVILLAADKLALALPIDLKKVAEDIQNAITSKKE